MRIPSDWENTLTVLFFASLIASMGLYLYLNPPAREAFFETGLLSGKGTIDSRDYFQSGSNTVLKGEAVSWTLQVISHMPDAQLVEWRIKLLNAIEPRVNSSLCEPSFIPRFFAVRQLILPGSTWNYPINWSIANATRTGNNTVLNSFYFNGTIYNPNLPAQNATGYYLLFELWYYTSAANDMSFGYPFIYLYKPGTRCWWLQSYFLIG